LAAGCNSKNLAVARKILLCPLQWWTTAPSAFRPTYIHTFLPPWR